MKDVLQEKKEKKHKSYKESAVSKVDAKPDREYSTSVCNVYLQNLPFSQIANHCFGHP